MQRPVAEIKRDIDKKFKEIGAVRKKIECAKAKLDKEGSRMTHFALKEAENKIALLERAEAQLQKEMEQIELEAYGTWIPRIREIKAKEKAKLAETERREEERRMAKNSARNARRTDTPDGMEAEL